MVLPVGIEPTTSPLPREGKPSNAPATLDAERPVRGRHADTTPLEISSHS
jgi:hypothetical protein